MHIDIDYDHQKNIHSQAGAKAALAAILAHFSVNSLLDVGCGAGTWLKAALDLGVIDILGIDGISISIDRLLVQPKFFQQQDLTIPWHLNRRFDLVICLEVAEHLDNSNANTLIEAIANHTDLIIFSAACPGQPGQHHVNCQWPTYWQKLFNSCGFSCCDTMRWKIWDDVRIEPWYRQNMFVAQRDKFAGVEARISHVIHPDMMSYFKDWSQ